MNIVHLKSFLNFNTVNSSYSLKKQCSVCDYAAAFSCTEMVFYFHLNSDDCCFDGLDLLSIHLMSHRFRQVDDNHSAVVIG